MKNNIYFLFVLTFLTVVQALSEDAICDKCMSREQCTIFQNMSLTQQFVWINKYPCSKILYNGVYIPYTNAVYVCCSDSLWAIEIGYNGGENNIIEPKYPKTEGGGVQENPNNYQNYYPPGPNIVLGGSNLNPVPRDPNVNGNPQQGIDNPVTGEPYYKYNTLPPFVTTTRSGQCLASSFLPNPQTGCCGLEASEPDRIIGGHETEFYQFPWTVQLISTFDFGQRRQSFDCGGSLISCRYVLTAGHCVYDASGTLIKVEAYLAEYDKTTFPKDCKTGRNHKRQCIDNIVIAAEEVVQHPQYDDDKLFNDIALIRLRQNAPYTAFIRPICLTPINLDVTNFANLQLTVAGWGRNGRYRSNIKQSTVVNLVPQEQCKKYYPGLLRSQMCAVGYSGQDTCKGDSGGPLMKVIGGKYYVVGIVSGKRADAPCGTAVPSLYTNVYQYVNWIHSNIRN